MFHHRILLSWVYQEPENIAERAKTAATNDGLLSFLSFSKNQAVKGVDDIRKTLNIIREFLERRLIAKEFQP